MNSKKNTDVNVNVNLKVNLNICKYLYTFWPLVPPQGMTQEQT